MFVVNKRLLPVCFLQATCINSEIKSLKCYFLFVQQELVNIRLTNNLHVSLSDGSVISSHFISAIYQSASFCEFLKLLVQVNKILQGQLKTKEMNFDGSGKGVL